MRTVDLRSDTVTMPTQEMRDAMMRAEVGDDVYGDDPTVARLEELSAEATGKEAALFAPSGTMANQLAIMAHTKKGDELILSKHSHIAAHEVGAAAILSGAGYCLVEGGAPTAADIRACARGDDIHCPPTGLVCTENALGSGKVLPVAQMRAARDAARELGLPVHLDGARLFNAALRLGVPAAEIARHADSVMFCLSKGLCAPVGSMLCGDAGFIKKARKYRKLLGGGMRQAGVLAAAGIIALTKMPGRLGDDHDNAQYLARRLAELPGVSASPQDAEINMVFFRADMPGLAERLAKRGIKINPPENGEYRFVTHNGVGRADIDYVIEEMAKKPEQA